MPTFIDESGDTGRNPDPANCHFRLAAVYVPTQDGVESIREAVREVRVMFGLRSHYEFKFYKTWNYPERRKAFFEAILKHDFHFAVASVDKRTMTLDCNVHRFAAVELAASLRPIYLAAHATRLSGKRVGPLRELVIVDDNEDKRFLAVLKEVFRSLGQACDPKATLVGKVKFRDSAPEELIQVADMVCGATAADLDGNNIWYQYIYRQNVGQPLKCQKKVGRENLIIFPTDFK